MLPRPSRSPEDDFYPDSDGQPMAEGDFYRELMMDLIEMLDRHFAADPAVYVSGGLLLYYQRGHRRRRVAPDVFVVRGVEKRLRRHYLLWNEGKPPDCLIEVTSARRRGQDGDKFRLYRDVLGVPEVFLFDPQNDYLRPSLQGYRLRKGDYERIDPVNGRLPSDLLGLHLEPRQEWLRFYDPQHGHVLPSNREEYHHYMKTLAECDRLRREFEQLCRQSRRP